ncbi:MAG: hypothetical protein H6719_26445 [Sandaracinaceae bacterium]|nr:hypothetical protein [Sandaracinaceae bacterium]
MSELLGTTIEDLIATMKERRVRIPSEIGAFIALEVCEALASGPAAVRPAEVRVADDGAISVFAPPGSATSEEAARAVVALLGGLLVAAGTGVPRVLVGLLEAGPSSGRWDLASLRDDLEASLVPLNRSAARRVLARMLREVRRPRSVAPSSRPAAAREPSDATLDDQLDDLLSGDEVPNRPASARPPAADLDAELDATLADYEGASALDGVSGADRTIAEDTTPFQAKKERKHPSHAPTQPGVDPKPKPKPATPTPSPGIDLEALGDELERPRRGSPLPWVLAFVAILAATAAALALSRPDLVDQLLGRPPAPEEPTGPTAEEQEQMLRDHRARFGTLTVRANPPQSQVLMFVGRGPAEATELPLGVAHELIAIADGRAPTRAFIPADATWETVGDGRRYELALQAGTAEMAEADLDLGPTTLPRDALGAPSGVLGTVRVITNPPNAKVYLLIGFSPEVVVENIRTDDVVELLVYHEGHPVQSAMVRPSDWVASADGLKTAEVDVTLEGYDPDAEE